jgi:HD-like signal output (HDOD) protein
MQSPDVRCLADIKNLPALPTVYHELQIKFSSSKSSLRDLGALISKDVALSAAVLKLVNSSFFGLANQVTSVQTAATLLGYDILRALVLHHVMFTKFAVSSFAGFSVVQNQNHSLNAAGLARQLAVLEGFERDECDRVFVGTVVHDIGKLILAERFSEHFKAVLSLAREKNQSFYWAEETLGFANHAAIGAYLLGLWGFDDQVVSAVLHHHDPGRCPSDNTILPFLHAADCIEGKHRDSNLESLWSGIDETFLARCGYAARKEAWTARAREVSAPEETQ